MDTETTGEVEETTEGVIDTPNESSAEETPNPLDMSDEAFAALLAQGFPETSDEETEENNEPPSVASDDGETVTSEEAAPVEETEAEALETTEEDEEITAAEETEVVELSAEDQLKELFTPFKANGREMSIDNIEDARTLMQMGANYNKKMAALKPNLKILKMLENNNLLDADRLNFLIDLDKQNPEAIKKLIQDSKLDLDEFDSDEKTSYKPNTYTVNDKEVELDETLASIKDTKSYAQTLDIISNKWDEASKQTLLEHPAGIAVLNQHVEMGVYDQVAALVDRERMLNRLPPGLSDLEAYKYVAEQINARGGLTSANKPAQQRQVSKTVKSTVDPKLNDRKRAASSTKSSPRKQTQSDINVLAMSDEEFAKVGLEKFL
jgi:hypothetical protein